MSVAKRGVDRSWTSNSAGARSGPLPPEGPVLSRRRRSLHMSRGLQIRANFVNECRFPCWLGNLSETDAAEFVRAAVSWKRPTAAGLGRRRFLADAIFAERFSLAAFPSDNITFLAASHASRLSPFFQRSFKHLRLSLFQHSRLSAVTAAFGGSRPTTEADPSPLSAAVLSPAIRGRGCCDALHAYCARTLRTPTGREGLVVYSNPISPSTALPIRGCLYPPPPRASSVSSRDRFSSAHLAHKRAEKSSLEPYSEVAPLSNGTTIMLILPDCAANTSGCLNAA